MGVEKDIIVAVELASTAIRAIAGKKEPDGTMQILAVAQDEAINTIHKGVVDNIDKTTQAIRQVVRQIDERLNVHTKKIYVGLSGQSLHSIRNIVSRQFPEKTQISHAIVDEMKDTNLGLVYPNAVILDVIPQEYRMGNRQVTEPVGMQSDQIEASFLNIVARTSLKENIEKCVQEAGFELAELLISPICLADSLLTPGEKRSGCALVDMGAETTTVSVFHAGILRHLAVIPLGGANVTADIAANNIETEEAEALKLKYATTYRNEVEGTTAKSITLSHNRTIDELVLQEIIEARYEELFANIWYHINERSERLLSGIILTGGAARVSDIVDGFCKHVRYDKQIRLAKGLPVNITTAPGVHIDTPDTLYTLMALLQKGDQPCVGEMPTESTAVQEELRFEPEGELKPEEKPAEPAVEEKPEEAEPANKEPKKPRESFGKKLRGLWEKVSDVFEEPED